MSPHPASPADGFRDSLEASLGGAYTLERELAGGGMSRVFLAQEIEFGRAIVVKVLPPDAAETLSAERFKREIAVAAKLQHPHIVPLLSAGEMHGLPYYTMPFVEGESLRQRLTREGELPVAETVGILREVARALSYAHERGVVHRDIKPDNVMLSGGTAVVTDFGVAKALSASTTQGDRTTITQFGVALGTPAYMSPEQASADPSIDARADLYAFGCMAYEMLTGSPPFSGRPPTALLAAHVSELPEPVQRRRPNVPPELAALVMRCLEKRPADRPRDADTVIRALDGIAVTPNTTASVAMRAHLRGEAVARASALGRWTPWLVAAALAAIVGAMALRDRSAADAAPPAEMRFAVAVPDGWQLARQEDALAPVALSPDGKWLAVRVARGDSTRIFVRAMDADEWRPVPGTENAAGVSFSGDGQSLVFVDAARGFIARVPLNGGPETQLAAGIWGATLGADGAAYYDKSYNSGLSRESSPGAAPVELTHPDAARHELGDWNPELLPDQKHVLFSTYGTPLSAAHVDVLDLGTGRRSTLVRGGIGAQIVDDVLLYVKDGVVQAAPIDPRRLTVTGASQPVLDSVALALSDGGAAYTVARTGTLAYVPASVESPDLDLVWLDRAGRPTPSGARPGAYRRPRLSPDGTRLGTLILQNGLARLWVYEFARGIFTPMSPDDVEVPAFAWGRDGHDLFYNIETPVYDVFRRTSDGAGASQPVSATPADKLVDEVTEDGRSLLVENAPVDHSDAQLATIDLRTPGAAPVNLNTGSRGGTQGSVSPDGKWLAYTSLESGRAEVYLRPFPDVERARRQISSGGGHDAHWTRGGHELVFIHDTAMTSVAFDPQTGIASPQSPLFAGGLVGSSGGANFDVSPDGSRFIVVRARERSAQYVVVVANWLQNVRVGLRSPKH